ncbi:F-box protein [Quillaja saponaria]|uniref:F-box protein n=1 Tax=Quillaja saponaria TaxID=32244 RepID=A0AAD7KV11_QUISA|nr:F-box protein [Quillaja saponaria]
MASTQIQTSSYSCSSSSSRINAAIHVPKLPKISFSVPKIPTFKNKLEIDELNGFTNTITPVEKMVTSTPIYQDASMESTSSKATIQLYAILEAVADRIEMHDNIGEQRDNWNTLLLNSTNMITLTATTMAGIAASIGGGAVSLHNLLRSNVMLQDYSNNSRPKSKLGLPLRNPTQEDVKDAMEKILALDKAYPLPLLGKMLEKFPSKYEPAVWWTSKKSNNKLRNRKVLQQSKKINGWSEELEMEMRECLLWLGHSAAAVNAFEHGGQVGMVFEMYRYCGGFFKLFENSIEATLEEKDLEKRENGELFQMNVALQLGRSLSQLQELATKSVASSKEGTAIDEFASNLF